MLYINRVMTVGAVIFGTRLNSNKEDKSKIH